MGKALLFGLLTLSLLGFTGQSYAAAPPSPQKAPAVKATAKPSPAKSKVVSLLIESFNGDTDVAAISAALKSSRQETQQTLQQAVTPAKPGVTTSLLSTKPEP